MVRNMDSSEFGGKPGMIQPDITGVDADAAAVGLGHESVADRAVDNRGVRDAAMVARRAGLREVNGIGLEPGRYDENGDWVFLPYDEERARDDLINGRND